MLAVVVTTPAEMTTSKHAPATHLHTPVDPDLAAQPPRKRRRRATTSGAADDCFACRKRAVTCDRKRPYCTQCIQIGKECSGYKTTLTWGVGVASRGKLRGQSYPIAKSKPSADSGKRRDDNGQPSVKRPATQDQADRVAVSTADMTSLSQLPLPVTTPVLPGTDPTTAASSHMPLATPHSIWPLSAQQPDSAHLPSYLPRHDPSSSFSRPTLQPIATAVHHQNYAQSSPADPSAPVYPTHLSNSPEHYHQSPTILFPQSASSAADQSISFPDPYSFSAVQAADQLIAYAASYNPPHDQQHGHSQAQRHTSSAFEHGIVFDPEAATMSSLQDDSGMSINSGLMNGFYYDEEDDVNEKTMTILDPRFSGTFFHTTPRVQSLMEYFDSNVLPILVAFDGPDNPYRKHILPLAFHSEGLQNAIAALATNNLRMRREVTPQRIGFVEEMTDGAVVRTKNEATPEELYFKKLSIDQLNERLKDVNAAQDDSVLASLLILCLFNVCDAGFSKFKTQLAGMQKLLSMRNGESDFTRLVQMFFVWFDTMTSTVNDREMQIRGEPLDLLNFATNLGALEQFSGCDGRLFKLIARLGRLNLLAQGRAVRASSNPTLPYTQDDLSGASAHMSGLPYPPTTAFPDHRTEFWHEWHDIRARLEQWQPTTPSPEPPSGARFSGTASDRDVSAHDLLHINEAFRHAALLYTARLGWPLLPSSHARFQTLVAAALRHHVAALPLTSPMNKFLLWPLFILGTECVAPRDRAGVRARCLELSKESGFYNNLSGLDVLERVWRDADADAAAAAAVGRADDAEVAVRRWGLETDLRAGRYPQAFRWRKAMDRVDGEYIVI